MVVMYKFGVVGLLDYPEVFREYIKWLSTLSAVYGVSTDIQREIANNLLAISILSNCNHQVLLDYARDLDDYYKDTFSWWDEFSMSHQRTAEAILKANYSSLSVSP